ncbi:MAG TPA: phosphopantetheine-binding protein, partial [Pyrinomonadaceae bacterium]|nr:phosphopantetheine-binding protein [Pyrinomonadaceae bacterium]
RCYVVERWGGLAPEGAAGELYVGGAQVGRGYWGRPALTAERFVPDPYGGEAGARLYRTGDVVRYLRGGVLDFVGRLDHQVKLRGHRVELGEVEAALCRHPKVRECAVVVREDVPGDKRLVAYLVAEPQTAIAEPQGFLRERLPEYMVPSAFVLLDELPLTPNGKVDRKALPAPDHGRPELECGFVAPATPLEEDLAKMWGELLGVEQVGVEDNFFELGGHSLLVMQVASRVRADFGLEVPLPELFRTPTVRRLAEIMEEAFLASSDADKLDEMLAQLEAAGDDQARDVLSVKDAEAR